MPPLPRFRVPSRRAAVTVGLATALAAGSTLLAPAGGVLPLAAASSNSAEAPHAAYPVVLPVGSARRPARAFLSRTALGSSTAVRVGTAVWKADHASSGGRSLTLRPRVRTPIAALLAHARVGASRFTVGVPAPGVYRVSLVLPAVGRSGPATRLVSGETPVVSGLRASTRSAQTVSFSVGVTSRRLVVAFAGPSLAVSGLQVVASAALPPDRALVPVQPVLTSAPASGIMPAAPVATTAWPSGAFPGNGNLPADVKAFGDFRHRALDVISTSVPGRTWSGMATEFYGIDRYASLPGRLSIAYPMLPYDRSGSFADVLAGKDDAVFTAFAQGLVARGRGDSIIRLGWEFNGDFFPWAAYNPATYIPAFRHEVALLRAADPAVVIDWNGNYGYSQVKLNPLTQLYPGDDVVDIVGVDAYDRVWFHVTNEATWFSYVHNPDGGLLAWYDFARRHGKRLSVPEWALYDDNPGGSDNPFYIQKMYGFFAQHASGIAYEAYFNEPNPYVGSGICCTRAETENPLAAAVYSELWG